MEIGGITVEITLHLGGLMQTNRCFQSVSTLIRSLSYDTDYFHAVSPPQYWLLAYNEPTDMHTPKKKKISALSQRRDSPS